jgi:pimeloyl-ACP methyl ester carboxylesterase
MKKELLLIIFGFFLIGLISFVSSADNLNFPLPRAMSGNVYLVNTDNNSLSEETPFSNGKILISFTASVCTGKDVLIQLDKNGYYEYNPKTDPVNNISGWNNILCTYKIDSMYIVNNSEIIGSLSNSYDNSNYYKNGDKFIHQYIRVHTDKPLWKDPSKETFLGVIKDNEKNYQVSFIEVPNNLTNNKNPVILVHGLNCDSGAWDPSGIVDKLHDHGYDAWTFYYPNNQEVKYSAALLADGISFIKQITEKSKVNLIGHSLGGLVVYSYVENLAKTPQGKQINYSGDVDKLIAIGSPFAGSNIANKIVGGRLDLAIVLGSSSINIPAHYDVCQGSEITWDLTKGEIPRDITPYTIAGTNDDLPLPKEDVVSDGLVSLTSVSFLKKSIPLISIHRDHAGEINNVDTPEIIRAILDNSGELVIKDNLNKQNGEYYINPGSEYSDENPYTRGSLLIKINISENVENVSLRSDSLIVPFKKNSLTGIWFHFNDNSSASDYTFSIPNDTYNLFINDKSTGGLIEIKPAETAFLEYSISNGSSQQPPSLNVTTVQDLIYDYKQFKSENLNLTDYINILNNKILS